MNTVRALHTYAGEYWHTTANTIAVVSFDEEDDLSTDLFISWTYGDSDTHSERITPDDIERWLAAGTLVPYWEPDGVYDGQIR